MALPPLLKNLKLPVVAAPLFIISNPDLVIAQCKAGVIGSFPALNARPAEELDRWLRITRANEYNDKILISCCTFCCQSNCSHIKCKTARRCRTLC